MPRSFGLTKAGYRAARKPANFTGKMKPFKRSFTPASRGAVMMRDVEKKFFDNVLDEVASSITGVFHSVLGNASGAGKEIPRGPGPKDRIGNKIYIHSLNVFGVLRDPGGAFTTGQVARVMVVLDHQSNGVAPTIDEILDTTQATPDTYAYRNLQNTTRFRVLMDKHIVQNRLAGAYTGGAADWAGVKNVFRYNVNFKVPLKVEYKTSEINGFTSDIVYSNIWVVMINETGTSDWVSVNTRIRYTD